MKLPVKYGICVHVVVRTFDGSMKSLTKDKKPWTTKLSSAGLVYLHFGHRIISLIAGMCAHIATHGDEGGSQSIMVMRQQFLNTSHPQITSANKLINTITTPLAGMHLFLLHS